MRSNCLYRLNPIPTPMIQGSKERLLIMKEEDPLEKLFLFYDLWYPPEFAEKLKKGTIAPDKVLDYGKLRSNLVEHEKAIKTMTEEYEREHYDDIFRHRLSKYRDGEYDTIGQESIKELRDNWNNIINKTKYGISYIIFFLLNQESLHYIFPMDYNISTQAELMEPIVKLVGEFGTGRTDFCFEEMAKLIKDGSNQLIEAFYKPVLVTVAHILGDHGFDHKMIGPLFNKLRQLGVEKMLPFILDEDIKLLRNAVSHNGFKLDMEREKICLWENGKLKKETSIEELGRLVQKIGMIRTDFEIARSMLDFMIQSCSSFTISVGDSKLLVEIVKIEDQTVIRLKQE
jgi:hypothetical protein